LQFTLGFGVWKNNSAHIFADDLGEHATPQYVGLTDSELLGGAAKTQVSVDYNNYAC